jgi:hypothetical protein
VAPEHDVVEHTHAVEERQILECARHAQRRDFVWRHAGDFPAVEPDAPDLGREKSRDGIGHGRFAAAIGADQTENLTAFDAQVDPREGNQSTEATLHVSTFEDGSRCLLFSMHVGDSAF